VLAGGSCPALAQVVRGSRQLARKDQRGYPALAMVLGNDGLKPPKVDSALCARVLRVAGHMALGLSDGARHGEEAAEGRERAFPTPFHFPVHFPRAFLARIH